MTQGPSGGGTPAADRNLAWVAVLSAIGLVILALVVGPGPLPVDLSLRAALQAGDPAPALLDALNVAGGALVWDAGVAALVGLLFLGHRRIDAAWLAGAVLCGEALDTAIKVLVDRPRPPGIAVNDLVTQASFPSGHVTRTGITLALVVLLLPRARPARFFAGAGAVVVTILMGLARIESGEHWPTDVLGAFMLVALVVALAVALRARLRRSAPGRRPRVTPDRARAARSP